MQNRTHLCSIRISTASISLDSNHTLCTPDRIADGLAFFIMKLNTCQYGLGASATSPHGSIASIRKGLALSAAAAAFCSSGRRVFSVVRL